MFRNRPALRLVLLFSAGIIISGWISLSPTWSFILIFILVIIAVIFLLINKWNNITDLLLQCAVILLGIFLQTLQQSNSNSRELEPRINDEPLILFGQLIPNLRCRSVELAVLFVRTVSFAGERLTEIHVE